MTVQREPFDVPVERPADLQTATPSADEWWRFDSRPASAWSWKPYPDPLYRFDPMSGDFRFRYAGDTLAGAVAERFETKRATTRDAAVNLVRLHGSPACVDLTDGPTRGALNVDERISIGRSRPTRPEATDPALDVCGHLADRVADWFGVPPTTILYRSRLHADRRNLAFAERVLEADPPTPETFALAHDREAITALIAGGVAVPGEWLDNLAD